MIDTSAIYIIHEDGKEFYFYTKHAGGFSYPFNVARFLRDLKCSLGKRIGQQDICVAPLLAQMKGNYYFPDALRDKLLFTETTKEISEGMEKDIPFSITLDVDQYTVAFHFNERFKELKSLADITFPCYEPTNRYSGGCFSEESAARQMEKSSLTSVEIDEIVYRELIEQAVEEQGRIQAQQMM